MRYLILNKKINNAIKVNVNIGNIKIMIETKADDVKINANTNVRYKIVS